MVTLQRGNKWMQKSLSVEITTGLMEIYEKRAHVTSRAFSHRKTCVGPDGPYNALGKRRCPVTLTMDVP